jgi:plasmid stabilization system protein ParE
MALINWTKTALKDIDAIAEFIALDSPLSASKFVTRLFSTTIKLEKVSGNRQACTRVAGSYLPRNSFKKI